jgi:hypothetical protein
MGVVANKPRPALERLIFREVLGTGFVRRIREVVYSREV